MSYDSRITYKNRPYSIWQIEEKTADENWKSERFSIIEEESLDAGLDTVDDTEFIGNGLDTQNQCSYECGTGRSSLIYHNPLIIEQEKDIIDLAQMEIHKLTLPSYHKSLNVGITHFHSSFFPYCDNFSSSFNKKCKYLHGTPMYGVCVDNLQTQLLRNSVLFEKHFYANNLYEIYGQNSAINTISYRYDACGIADKILSEIRTKKRASNNIGFLQAEEDEFDEMRRSEELNNTWKTYNVGGLGSFRNESEEMCYNSTDNGDNKIRKRNLFLYNHSSHSNINNKKTSDCFSDIGDVIEEEEMVSRREDVSIRNNYTNISSSNVSSIDRNARKTNDNNFRERNSGTYFITNANDVVEIETKNGPNATKSNGGSMAMRLGSYVSGFSIGNFGKQLPRRTSYNTSNSEDSFSDLPIPLPYPASQRTINVEEAVHLNNTAAGNTRDREKARANLQGHNMDRFERLNSNETNINQQKEEERHDDMIQNFQLTRNNHEDIFRECSSFEDSDFILPDLIHNNVFLF